jgi:hypothetical protein
MSLGFAAIPLPDHPRPHPGRRPFAGRATKRRQIAKDVMVELDLKKLSAPDFIASIRPGIPALMVIDEAAGKSQGLFGKKRTLRRGP